MKQLIRAVSVCLTTFGILFFFTAGAQVHTARTSIAVSSKCKGYYEYLPAGYDPNGTATYPLIVFLTGIGEFGDGTAAQLPRVLKNGPPKLIDAGTFPASFSVLGQTHRFIVITPQFTSTPVVAADVEAVMQYMVSRYKVNPNRVYLTGLSYGGGLCFAYTGNDNTSYRARVAAIVPTANPLPDGGDATIYARSRVIAAGNIPVWATHNSGDAPPDSSSNTISYVNYINQAPAPNPLAKKTIFDAGGHDSWSTTYNPDYRENGYSIYEWMLLHVKGSPPPAANQPPVTNAGADKTLTLPANSVTLTATASDPDGTIASYNWKQVYGPGPATITSPNSASSSFTSLVQGYYTFRMTASDDKGAKATDDVKVVVNAAAVPGAKTINVNIYAGANAYSSTAWNNWNVSSSLTSASLKYSDGVASVVKATLSATSSVSDNGTTYGSGMAPAEVLRHTSSATSSRTLTLNGLATSKTYNLEFYASRNSSTAGSTVFTINGTAVTVSAYNNLSKKAVFNNIAPNSSGQIVASITRTATYNYLNGFSITENPNTTTNPTKYVKTNIYGGTNPFANTEWNNWNVSASLKASALKYSDATVSSIGVALSAMSSVLDNGATYGGTMAPPEVLRYTCSGTARTLTFSGLSATKTYSLELYASRGNSGNSTVFTIGGTSVTVVTDYNKTTKASFSNLKPNTSGQLVVSINKTANFSYLNGFILGETTTGTTSAASATATNLAATEEIAGTGLSSPAIGLFPNPAGSNLTLTLNNSYKGAVSVQITDATGKSQKELRLVKSSAVMQQPVPIATLAKGVYFVTVSLGAQRQTLRFSKL